MSIFNFFNKKHSSGVPRGDAARVLQELERRQLIVLSLNEGNEFNGDPNSEDDVLLWLERNAQQTSTQEEFYPYQYEEEGYDILPIFSSAETAQEFVQSDPENQWKAFTLSTLDGKWLLDYFVDAYSSNSQVVLDARSSSEQSFSYEQIVTARES